MNDAEAMRRLSLASSFVDGDYLIWRNAVDGRWRVNRRSADGRAFTIRVGPSSDDYDHAFVIAERDRFAEDAIQAAKVTQ